MGQAFASLIEDTEKIVNALSLFKARLPLEVERVYQSKLGLLHRASPQTVGADTPLAEGILQVLAQERVDYSIFWRQLSTAVLNVPRLGRVAFQGVNDLFLDARGFESWLDSYLDRLKSESLEASAQCMLKSNPKFVLRNHLCETAIQAANAGDASEIERLMHVLSTPFDEHPGFESFADHPPHWAQSLSISCSS